MKIFVQESCNLFAKKPLARKNWPFSRRCVLCFWENASESDFRCSFFSVEQSEEERTLSLKWQRQTRLCPTVVYFSQRFSKCILQSVFSKYIFQNIFIFKVYFLKALPLKFIFLYFYFKSTLFQVYFPKCIFQNIFFKVYFSKALSLKWQHVRQSRLCRTKLGRRTVVRRPKFAFYIFTPTFRTCLGSVSKVRWTKFAFDMFTKFTSSTFRTCLGSLSKESTPEVFWTDNCILYYPNS